MRSFRALRLLQELSRGVTPAGSGTAVSHGLSFREVCRVVELAEQDVLDTVINELQATLESVPLNISHAALLDLFKRRVSAVTLDSAAPRVKSRNSYRESADWICSFLEGKDFTSPSVIGRAHADAHGIRSENHHSSWASPICKRMVAEGLLERNQDGCYRLLHRG